MAKFVEFTGLITNEKICFNIDHISSFGVDGDGDLQIMINGSAPCVKESYEEVKKLLGVE